MPWRSFLRGGMKRRIVMVGGVTLGVASAVELYRSIDCLDDISQIGLIRFGRAAVAVSHIVYDYKSSLRRVEYPSDEYTKTLSDIHKRSANRLLELACANGGVFIKVGQHCASLEYLLPKEYTSTLAVLMAGAPASSFEDVKGVVEVELGRKLEDMFSEFSDKPCGAASLAQVHIARLKDTGEKLAVKVQHRRVLKNSRTDINTMDALVKVTDLLFPDAKLRWLVDEVKRNLPLELDFLLEANNADKIRETLKDLPFVKIPKIYRDMSTHRLLTMEFCEGEQINRNDYMLEKKIDRHDVCRKLGRVISEMIFIRGNLHCDLHPGNVLVNKKENGQVEIVLLDHGLYLALDNHFRKLYADLWMAILNADQMQIKRVATQMGVGDLYGLFACMVTRRSWKSVTEGISKSTLTEAERDELRKYAVSLIPQISEVLQRMPREMLLILKTNDLLRGIEFALKTNGRADGLIEVSKCVVRSSHELALAQTPAWRERLRLHLSLFYQLTRLVVYDWLLLFNSFLPQSVRVVVV